MHVVLSWTPAVVLSAGALATLGIQTQRSLPLREPLGAAVPLVVAGHLGRAEALSPGAVQLVGVTEYLMRFYAPPGRSDAGFSLYVGYYDRQTRGKTIHSPKHCLPGAGWEPLTSQRAAIATSGDSVTVNRYLLQREGRQVLVLYWYQGRGRVQANEYIVKWDLLRDAAFRGRSDEALVRVIVPVTSSEEEAFQLAARVARGIIPDLHRALPS